MAYLLSTAVLVFAANGIGRLIWRPAFEDVRTRVLIAQMLSGALAFTALFGVLLQASIPSAVALGAVVAFLVAGSAVSVWDGLRCPQRFRRGLLLSALVVAPLMLTIWLPVNPNAIDPQAYAYLAATAFQPTWGPVSLGELDQQHLLTSVTREGRVARAASLAFLWPAALLGVPVRGTDVVAVGAWLLLVSSTLIIDVLPLSLPVLARAIAGVGAIGLLNATSVLVGGQLNQPMAVMASVAAIWFVRHGMNATGKLLSLGFVGVVIAAGYPEFIAALPVYVICLALLPKQTLRSVLSQIVALAAGIALVEAWTLLGTSAYLLEQSGEAPQWWPLEHEPSNTLELLVTMLVERPTRAFVLILAIPLAWLLLRSLPRFQPSAPPRTLVFACLACMAVLLGAWSFVIFRAPNVNYSAFKLAGWAGPALLIAAVLALEVAPHVARIVGLVLIVAVAIARTTLLVAEIPARVVGYARTSSDASWRFEQTEACTVVVSPGSRQAVFAAIAESAAPYRGCHVSAVP